MEVIEFRKCSKCEYTGRIQVCKKCYSKSEFTPRKAIKKIKIGGKNEKN